MNFKKFFRNPEVKRISIKFLIILILGIISLVGVVGTLESKIINMLSNQNAITFANVLDAEKGSDIAIDFYEIKSEEEIEKAKEILSSYGYNDNISKGSNEVLSEIVKQMYILYIPIFILFILVLYLLFLKELKGIYNQVDTIVSESSSMSNGEYKKIEGNFEEGEMAVLISSLNYMGDRVNNSIELLKTEKEYLKDFLSDISHQLKTPLASLIMFNDLLKENKDMPYEDRVKFLDKCEEQLGRMEWLIMNLLKVGRLEAGVINFKEEKQSLRDTIELAVSSLRGEAKNKNQNLIVDGKLDAEIKHDREWLAEAISNIVKNAIEHTHENGEIEVRVEKGPIITKIYIKDNGPGISEEMQKKVFKRFYKGESSRNPKSIGIGLSLSKSIVEEQGGEIKLLSEEGKGTTFILSFMDSLK